MNSELTTLIRKGITSLCIEAHALAKHKGWYDRPHEIPEAIALMHSELSEALEEYRIKEQVGDGIYYDADGKPCGIGIEFADLLIRLTDACQYFGIDLGEAVIIKHEYNKTRPRRHGGKRC